MLWVGQHRFRILLGAEDSLFPTIIQSGCYSLPHLFNGYCRWGVQWLGYEVHHLLLSSAELKNEWSYIQGVPRVKVTTTGECSLC